MVIFILGARVRCGHKKKGRSNLKWQKPLAIIQNSNFITYMFCISLIVFFFFNSKFLAAISREDGEDSNHHQHQINHFNHSSSSKRIWKQSWHQHRSGHSNEVPFNGYNSEEYLDRLEPNGNIPANKSDLGYGKRKCTTNKKTRFFFSHCFF